MVKLSDDLQKKGVLKTQHEVDKFWKDFGDQGGLSTDIFKRDPLEEGTTVSYIFKIKPFKIRKN